MEGASKVNPLIVTQKPSRASLHHQSSVDSSDEDYGDPSPSPSPLPPRPPSPSPSPSPSASYPANTCHSVAVVSHAHLLRHQITSQAGKLKDKTKKKKRPFLFRRKKKHSSSQGSLEPPGSLEAVSSDDGAITLKEFADILVDPSRVRSYTPQPGNRLLSLPALAISRSVSDSAVDRAGLEEEEEAGVVQRGREREKGAAAEEEEEEKKSWLVQVTLESGHGLAVRDRTGTSDPYVKFKCSKFKYRSTVVNRNLNPEWNEAFSFISGSLRRPLEVNVYDHDYGSLDDYMGGGTVALDSYTPNHLHIVEIGLRDPNARESSLGFIRIFLSISEHIEEPGEPEEVVPHSIQEWNSVVTIHLLNGNSLPAMDDNGFSDPYCKFKLGRQKRRSKVVTRSLNPDWKEKFDLRLYRGEDTTLHIEVWDRDLLQSDDFIGETCVKLDTLTREQTHDLTLPLQGHYHRDDYGTIHLLLTITGTTVHEVQGDEEVDSPPTTTSLRWKSRSVADMKELMSKYMLSQSLSLKLLNDIGHVTVVIDCVEGLGKTADVFAIAEVGNSQARTHTVYKTATPFWGKAFHFDLKDIHTTLEVSVYSDKTKPELIGRVKIPLLKLDVGVNKGYVLKDKRCLESTHGVLYLKCHLVYQPVRAALRTLSPRESKLMEKEVPFKRKVLMQNIKRITALVNDLSVGMVWMRHIYNWESKLHSFLALLLFIVGCLVFELWMVPLLLMIGLLVQYGVVYGRGKHHWQLMARKKAGSELSLDGPAGEVVGEDWSDWDDDLDDVSGQNEGGKERKNIRQKFRQVQAILLIVQNVLGEIADTGERINNLLAWKVPFLCWFCISLLFIATVVTIVIPLRYIILAWGVNKLTKKLRKPNHIPNNELRDLLSCSPTNRDLTEYRELSTVRRLSRPSSSLARRGSSRQASFRGRSRSPRPCPRGRSLSSVKKNQLSVS